MFYAIVVDNYLVLKYRSYIPLLICVVSLRETAARMVNVPSLYRSCQLYTNDHPLLVSPHQPPRY